MQRCRMFIPAIWFLIMVFSALPALAEMIVDTAWVRRYGCNGPGAKTDHAYAIAVEGSGNVYVTGFSYGTETWADYATIKYYPTGDTAWVRRYNGPGNDADVALAIAVDGSGNAYVTGWSDQSSGDPFNYDYATLKYDAQGNELWARRYSGPGNRDDNARAMAVDSSGNVYVTGDSYGTVTDYATIKYYPSGDTAWVRRYNGPGNSWDGAYAIAVDGSGNVYVTGFSYGTETQADYATIKYYPTGDTAWVRRYNGPQNFGDHASAIAIDASGNVYVTGLSSNGSSSDYATLKYDAQGNELWARRYNGPGSAGDEAHAIAVDGLGNICVTGRSYSNETSWDYATIKYYPSGDTAWVRRYNGPDNSVDYAYALAIDGLGNVYVTGDSYGTVTDYATIKYYPSGDTAWVRRYNGPGNENDWAEAIAVDGFNNVYVTGPSDGIDTQHDYATIKYFQALRGDVNVDAAIDVGDVVYLVSYLYKAGPAPQYMVIGDCNCDEIVNVGDVVYLVSYLYRGGPPPEC